MLDVSWRHTARSMFIVDSGTSTDVKKMPGQRQTLYFLWKRRCQCGLCLRRLQYKCTVSRPRLCRLLVSPFVYLCPAYHNTNQYAPTRKGTNTTKANPNLTVSTIMLGQTYVPTMLGVPYSFTLSITTRAPRAMLSQLRAHHPFEYLETDIFFQSRSQVHRDLLLCCRRIFYSINPTSLLRCLHSVLLVLSSHCCPPVMRSHSTSTPPASVSVQPSANSLAALDQDARHTSSTYLIPIY